MPPDPATLTPLPPPGVELQAAAMASHTGAVTANALCQVLGFVIVIAKPGG
jgi:hypothetical protein